MVQRQPINFQMSILAIKEQTAARGGEWIVLVFVTKFESSLHLDRTYFVISCRLVKGEQIGQRVDSRARVLVSWRVASWAGV